MFIGTAKQGWRLTNLRVVESFFRQALGGATPPTDMRAQAIVFTLTKEGTERYSFPGTLNPFQVYRNSLYVQYSKIVNPSEIYRTNGRSLRPEDHCFCRWTGRGLEELNPEEAKAVYASTRTLMVGSSADGWRWDYVNLNSPLHAAIDGVDLTVTQDGDLFSAQSLTVRRSTEKAAEVLWSGDWRPRRVDRKEYEAVFGSKQ